MRSSDISDANLNQYAVSDRLRLPIGSLAGICIRMGKFTTRVRVEVEARPVAGSPRKGSARLRLQFEEESQDNATSPSHGAVPQVQTWESATSATAPEESSPPRTLTPASPVVATACHQIPGLTLPPVSKLAPGFFLDDLRQRLGRPRPSGDHDALSTIQPSPRGTSFDAAELTASLAARLSVSLNRNQRSSGTTTLSRSSSASTTLKGRLEAQETPGLQPYDTYVLPDVSPCGGRTVHPPSPGAATPSSDFSHQPHTRPLWSNGVASDSYNNSGTASADNIVNSPRGNSWASPFGPLPSPLYTTWAERRGSNFTPNCACNTDTSDKSSGTEILLRNCEQQTECDAVHLHDQLPSSFSHAQHMQLQASISGPLRSAFGSLPAGGLDSSAELTAAVAAAVADAAPACAQSASNRASDRASDSTSEAETDHGCLDSPSAALDIATAASDPAAEAMPLSSSSTSPSRLGAFLCPRAKSNAEVMEQARSAPHFAIAAWPPAPQTAKRFVQQPRSPLAASHPSPRQQAKPKLKSVKSAEAAVAANVSGGTSRSLSRSPACTWGCVSQKVLPAVTAAALLLGLLGHLVCYDSGARTFATEIGVRRGVHAANAVSEAATVVAETAAAAAGGTRAAATKIPPRARHLVARYHKVAIATTRSAAAASAEAGDSMYLNGCQWAWEHKAQTAAHVQGINCAMKMAMTSGIASATAGISAAKRLAYTMSNQAHAQTWALERLAVSAADAITKTSLARLQTGGESMLHDGQSIALASAHFVRSLRVAVKTMCLMAVTWSRNAVTAALASAEQANVAVQQKLHEMWHAAHEAPDHPSLPQIASPLLSIVAERPEPAASGAASIKGTTSGGIPRESTSEEGDDKRLTAMRDDSGDDNSDNGDEAVSQDGSQADSTSRKPVGSTSEITDKVRSRSKRESRSDSASVSPEKAQQGNQVLVPFDSAAAPVALAYQLQGSVSTNGGPSRGEAACPAAEVSTPMASPLVSHPLSSRKGGQTDPAAASEEGPQRLTSWGSSWITWMSVMTAAILAAAGWWWLAKYGRHAMEKETASVRAEAPHDDALFGGDFGGGGGSGDEGNDDEDAMYDAAFGSRDDLRARRAIRAASQRRHTTGSDLRRSAPQEFTWLRPNSVITREGDPGAGCLDYLWLRSRLVVRLSDHNRQCAARSHSVANLAANTSFRSPMAALRNITYSRAAASRDLTSPRNTDEVLPSDRQTARVPHNGQMRRGGGRRQTLG